MTSTDDRAPKNTSAAVQVTDYVATHPGRLLRAEISDATGVLVGTVSGIMTRLLDRETFPGLTFVSPGVWDYTPASPEPEPIKLTDSSLEVLSPEPTSDGRWLVRGADSKTIYAADLRRP